MKQDTLWAITFLVFVAAIIGWVMNLVQVISMTSDTLTVLLALKIVGIIVPFIGAILGYV